MSVAYFVHRAAMSRAQDERSVKFYDAFPAVRQLYGDIATWTGVPEERVIGGDLPEEHELRNSVLAIRSIAAQIAVHDVLVAEGVCPQVVVALSLGISSASAMIGALSRPDLFGLLWHRRFMPEPAPDGPAEGVAFCCLAADSDLDRIYSKEHDGIYVGVDFGVTPDGLCRNVLLSGHREALERLADEDPRVTMGAGTTAKHSPLRKPVSDFLREYVSTLTFADPAIPLATCQGDRLLTTAEEVCEAIWWNDSHMSSVPSGITQAVNANAQLFLVPGPSTVAGIIDFTVPVMVVQEPADIETVVAAVNRLPSALRAVG